MEFLFNELWALVCQGKTDLQSKIHRQSAPVDKDPILDPGAASPAVQEDHCPTSCRPARSQKKNRKKGQYGTTEEAL
jgi:hypothetical protein